MDVIEGVGLYDTPHEPVHLHVPTPKQMATEQVVEFNPLANFASTTYLLIIEDILGRSALSTDIITDKNGCLITIGLCNDMNAENSDFKDMFH